LSFWFWCSVDRRAVPLNSLPERGPILYCHHENFVHGRSNLQGRVFRLLMIEDDHDGYRLAVELHAQLPGIDHAQAQRIMDEAHITCPYSKALRGDTSVTLVVD
jgi:hypothetical protein